MSELITLTPPWQGQQISMEGQAASIRPDYSCSQPAPTASSVPHQPGPEPLPDGCQAPSRGRGRGEGGAAGSAGAELQMPPFFPTQDQGGQLEEAAGPRPRAWQQGKLWRWLRRGRHVPMLRQVVAWAGPELRSLLALSKSLPCKGWCIG